MDFINTLDENSVLIIPNNIKDKILKYIDDNKILKSIKIMTFNDLKKGLLFDYTNEAIHYVMKNYHVNYGVAKNYINNLYYINEDKYDSDKLNFLFELKNNLISNNLLIKDNLFKSLIKSKKNIYVYGFDYIKKFDKYLLNLISDIADIHIINKNCSTYYHEVYNLNTMDKEVSFIAEEILNLVEKGVDINKIYIANYSDEYYFSFNRIFNRFNLPFYIKSETSLYTTAMGTYFINNLMNNLDLLLYKIRKRFDIENNKINEVVYNKLASMVNNYYWCDDIVSIKDLIIEEMRHLKIPVKHKKYEIKTIDILNNSFNDDEYIFLIGFNLGSIPKLKRDEDYINDAIKPDFIETTDEYNKVIKEAYINAIKSIKNITITYKMSSAFNSYYPSFLIDGISLKNKNIDYTVSNYSHELNKLNLAKRIDNLIKFNEYSSDLEVLNNTYNIDYKTYDNRFSGVDNLTLFNKINDNIAFSYSNINSYYECPFKFYISSILMVNEFENTLDQFIGSLFHYCLEKCLNNKDVSIDSIYDEFIELNKDKLKFTNKEKFFINILKKEIHFIIDAIREQYKHSHHLETWNEKKIELDVERKIKTKIKGFVDKVLVLNNYVLIIDYKTNNTSVDKDLFEFGIKVQLPMYLYLLKELDSNIEVAGMYLQHVLNLDMKYDKNKDVIEEKKKNLKLDGITFKNIDLISKFDDSYESSKVIQSLRIDSKLNDFKLNKRVLSMEDRDELTNLMEKLIYNCIDSVVDGKFDINPIKINSKYVDGCKYCLYKDICFRKPKDFNYQEVVVTGGNDNE